MKHNEVTYYIFPLPCATRSFEHLNFHQQGKFFFFFEDSILAELGNALQQSWCYKGCTGFFIIYEVAVILQMSFSKFTCSMKDIK